jgi:hypothetical protein
MISHGSSSYPKVYEIELKLIRVSGLLVLCPWNFVCIIGIVSRDFEVCFLVPLDSSDIATPSETSSFFLKSISC